MMSLFIHTTASSAFAVISAGERISPSIVTRIVFASAGTELVPYHDDQSEKIHPDGILCSLLQGIGDELCGKLGDGVKKAA